MDTIISYGSFIIAIATAVFTLVTYWRGVRHDRRQSTLEAFQTLQSEAFDKLNLYMPKDIAEIARNPQTREYKIISGYVARIEHFCVGVKKRIYDRRTVYLLAHGYMDGSALRKRIEPVIERKQTNATEDYYQHIHWLWKWMEKEQRRRK